MTAAEESHQHFVDDIVLPDDDLAKLREIFWRLPATLSARPSTATLVVFMRLRV
jgi:hypothetical protein